MAVTRWVAMVGLAGASAAVSAQTLNEGFDDVAGLASAGWVQLSNGSAEGDGWFQGNDGIFPAAAGAPTSYAAANWVSSTGSVSDWLMTPVLNLPLGGMADFALRLLGEGYLDTVQVYTSNAGAGTDPASFSLLASYGAFSDTGWLNLSLALPAMDGRLAFRYVIADTELAGSYAGLDSLAVTGVVPEPGTGLLLALGGAALLLRRRATR